jgi:PAS domain S-box-containing protein
MIRKSKLGKRAMDNIRPIENRKKSHVGDCNDSMERKQEKKATKNEKHLKFILENSIDAVYQRNIQTDRYDYMSPVIENITGFSAQEMVNLSMNDLAELIHPDDLEAISREIELTSKGAKESGHVVYRFRNKTGEYRWLEDRFSLIRDNEDQPLYRVGIVRDVTQTKQAEEALSKSEERFRQYFSLGLVGMAIESPSGEWLEVNEKLCEMIGYTREELMQVHWKDITHPDDLDGDVAFFDQLQQGKINRYSMEKRYIHKNGEIIYAILSLGCTRLSDGNISSIFVLIADITEQKHAEEALARYKDKLEIKVKERTEQLQRAYDQIIQSQKDLREANKQLRQYSNKITLIQEEERKRIAYELHDDTAQYLSILKMQIGVLAASDKIQSPEIREKLKYLERDADRAFHDVRRYSHELRPTVLEHQGLTAALEQIADDYNKLGELPVELNIEGVEPDLSEEVKLGFFRIAQEALNNTRKQSKATRSLFSIAFLKEKVRMSITDNGTGFSTREAKARFSSKGSLGLMSMRERANLIGAHLKIESKLGQGTVISIEIPL